MNDWSKNARLGTITRPRRLAADDRQALAMLAHSPEGLPKELLAAHGFKIERLTALVRDGLAIAQSETVRAGGRRPEITRLRITDAGRRALAMA
jgi:hypothetical protein